MGLDVRLMVTMPTEVFEASVTHNLSGMAEQAGILRHLWYPAEAGVTKAGQLVEPLRAGIALMEADPDRFRAFDPPNGWGSYDRFVPWLREYLAACEEYPDADVVAYR